MSTLSVATSGVPPPVNTTAPTSTPSPIPLPNWDNAEVEKRLKENAEALKEWSALLDKADIAAAKNEDVPQSDINQHNALKRKLHENLGIMAKMVQSQIKQKKPATEGAVPAPAGTVPAVSKPIAA